MSSCAPSSSAFSSAWWCGGSWGGSCEVACWSSDTGIPARSWWETRSWQPPELGTHKRALGTCTGGCSSSSLTNSVTKHLMGLEQLLLSSSRARDSRNVRFQQFGHSAMCPLPYLTATRQETWGSTEPTPDKKTCTDFEVAIILLLTSCMALGLS